MYMVIDTVTLTKIGSRGFHLEADQEVLQSASNSGLEYEAVFMKLRSREHEDCENAN